MATGLMMTFGSSPGGFHVAKTSDAVPFSIRRTLNARARRNTMHSTPRSGTISRINVVESKVEKFTVPVGCGTSAESAKEMLYTFRSSLDLWCCAAVTIL